MAENTLYLDWARDVLDTEAEGLREIAAALNHDFVRAAEALLHCKGRVVITGRVSPDTSAAKWRQPWLPPARPRFSSILPKQRTAIWA